MKNLKKTPTPAADPRMLPVSLTAECLSLTRSIEVKTSFVKGDELILTATYAGLVRPAVVYTLTAPATWTPQGGIPLLLPSTGEVTVTATHTITDADELHSGTDANVTPRSTFADDLIATATTAAAGDIDRSKGKATLALNFDHRHALLKINIVGEANNPYPTAGIDNIEIIVRMNDATTTTTRYTYYRLGVDGIALLTTGATPLILPIAGREERIEAIIVTTVTGHSYTYTLSPARSYAAGKSYDLTLTYEGITSFTLDESGSFGQSMEEGKKLVLDVAGYNYTIRNEADLRAFAANVNADSSQRYATAIQVADIELTGEWVPIGQSDSFEGVYNGNGHTISGMRITTGTYNGTGLFGYTAGATLTGIHLREVDIRSKGTNTGALVGFAADFGLGCISLCSAGGTVAATNNVGYVGGLVGANFLVDISRCRSECSVSAISDVSNTNLRIGGLVGLNDGTLSASQATGNVTADLSGQDVTIHAGALVGRNNNTINSCYATGKVEAGSADGTIYVGGLAGSNEGAINNSYATGGAEAVKESSRNDE